MDRLTNGCSADASGTRPAVPTDTGGIWTGSFVSLLLANLLLCFGFYMLPATLPAHVKQMGGTNLEASMVIGVFSVMSLFSRTFSSAAVAVVGERPVIVGGIIAIVVTTLTFVWAPIGGILAARCVQGIGWGLSTAAIATAVYKVVPESRRGEGSGYYSLTVITAASLTPLVAILLMGSVDFAVLLSVSASITLASTLLLKWGLAGLPQTNVDRRSSRKMSWRDVFEPGALLPSGLCFLLSIPLCGVIAYLVLLGQERNLGRIWAFFVGYALMIIVTRPTTGRPFDRKGHTVIVIPGSLAMIAGLLCLSWTQSTAMLIASSLLYGLGYGAVQPSLHTWAVNRCPSDRKAAANGLFMSAIDMGYIVGAVTLGLLAGWAGFGAMYRYATLAIVALIGLYLVELSQAKAPRNNAPA